MQINILEVLQCGPCKTVFLEENPKNLKIGIYKNTDTHLFDKRWQYHYTDLRELTTQELFLLQVHWS